MFHRLNVFLIPLVAGCAQAPAPTPPDRLVCEPPRPQVCTMVYDPVCAQYEDGTEETRSSACNACADDTVTAYRPGSCENTPQ